MSDLPELLAIQSMMVASAVVFFRVAAVFALVPGFGQTLIPMRLRLGLAMAVTLVLFPLIDTAAQNPITLSDWLNLFFSETLIGLFIGLLLRALVFALQTAASIAAQSTSLAQIFGQTLDDPMPAIGNLFLIGALALLMILGFHVSLIQALAHSYGVIPLGQPIASGALLTSGVAELSHAFYMAFGLAAPFWLGGLLYNIGLGAINRAMPQLMVAFIGAPALTFLGLFLILVALPLILQTWSDAMFSLLLEIGAHSL